MGTKTLLSLALGALVLVLGFAWMTRASTPTAQTPAFNIQTQGQTQTAAQTKTQPETPPQNTGSSGYTMADVAAHGSAQSCWAAINGKVYDLTAWIDQHPGGTERILSICGTDGSAAFNAQHGGQRRPEQELAQFLIGPLAQ